MDGSRTCHNCMNKENQVMCDICGSGYTNFLSWEAYNTPKISPGNIKAPDKLEISYDLYLGEVLLKDEKIVEIETSSRIGWTYQGRIIKHDTESLTIDCSRRFKSDVSEIEYISIIAIRDHEEQES